MRFRVSELLLFDLAVIGFNCWLAIREGASDHFWLCVAGVAIGVGLAGVVVEVTKGFRRDDRP